MRRREFITLLGGAAAWPVAARAQQSAMPVIGFLHPGSPATTLYAEGFRQGLREGGYVEGQNIVVEYRWANGEYNRLPGLAADLAARGVTVLAVGGGRAPTLAARAATSKIPVIFHTGTDPIADGLVESFNRPTGNVTGVYALVNVLVAKQLQVLHEALPTATVMAILDNPTSPSSAVRLRELNSAALELGLKLAVLDASTDDELATAFASLARQRVGGLVVGPDPFFTSRRDQIAAFALRYAVATIGSFREYAMAGSVMSYGPNFTDSYRLIGTYVARILKGTHLADLPVQQSTKVEFVINLKTAKALGLTIPLPLIGRADEVIE
jgi:ABC-type uncharacterized transport system substrate-binding protein